MKKVFAILVFLVLLIGLVGCGEESDVSSKTASTSSKAEASVEKGSDSSGSFADKFSDFASKKLGMEYTVEYDMTSKSGGQTDSLVLKQYFGGEDRIRSDMTVQGMESRTFILEDGIYSCNNNQGQWGCMKFGTKDDISEQESSMAFQDVEKTPDAYDISYAGTMKVAGTTAHCYGIAMPTGLLKECFSKEGVPLYMEVKSAGFESIMKATTYKTSVKSSDFDLPAEPTDAQAMMADMMEQMGGQVPEGYDMPE